ncbi:MAG: hypothetical protein CMO80_04875 [Verrucomicrobiales bacterium]|nr:hypothetical protein [Verrucomicrobiales bacterium]
MDSKMSEAARRIIHVLRRYTADEWGGTETVIQEIAGIPVRRYDYCYPLFQNPALHRLAIPLG